MGFDPVSYLIGQKSGGGGAVSWTFIGEETGSTEVSLPSQWKELVADVYYDNIHWTVPILRDALKGTSNYFRQGYYYNSTYNGGCSISVDTDKAVLQSCFVGQSDKTTSTTVRYYWR